MSAVQAGYRSFTLNFPRGALPTRLRGRHLLVPRVDRVEAVVLVLAVLISLIAVPVAGAVGTGVQAAAGGALIWAGATAVAATLYGLTRSMCRRIRQSRWDNGLSDLSDESARSR